MLVAHELGRRVLPPRSSRFSRKDFTLAQLFACLVLREFAGLSFRDTEMLLRDVPWCQQLGMKRVPDHNTLQRAFHVIAKTQRVTRLMDLLTREFQRSRLLGWTLAIDSTLLDTHHRSRHYEQRCRHHAAPHRRSADWRRSASAKRTPKLGIAVDTRSHAILAMLSKTGMGSDAPDFDRLLYDAWRRHRVRDVLADAGYDSESNHCIARQDLGVRSWIRTGIGRPTSKAPAKPHRRRMHRMLRGSQRGRRFGQRAQAETVMSMLKRNLGDALRARQDKGRRMELCLRVITHDVMLLPPTNHEDRDRAGLVPTGPAKHPNHCPRP